MYGKDEPSPGMGGGGGGGNPFHMNGRQMHPEDIFNMFFEGQRGGGFGGGNFRTFNFGGPAGGRQRGFARDQDQDNEGGSNRAMGLLQILPMLLLLFLSMGGFGSNTTSSNNYYERGNNAPYSFHKAEKYQLFKETTLLDRNIRIPYYVGHTFDSKYGKSLPELKKIEKLIYQEYKDVLYTKCYNEKETRRRAVEKVRL